MVGTTTGIIITDDMRVTIPDHISADCLDGRHITDEEWGRTPRTPPSEKVVLSSMYGALGTTPTVKLNDKNGPRMNRAERRRADRVNKKAQNKAIKKYKGRIVKDGLTPLDID